ncbi:riboflavin synthase [Desulforhabdus amnigena]|jgi:riboflavin synthase|uniref:Riboflavin synthase n=1 Tax=Desulforhabdus amnigena TaxID=40218 RepID=A0A9W6D2T1_9BACT|nr:riboflavin synthase [Desulforhabdus amnigena]NLJ28837.1 riboflavin synthase [Deltaproteobacteria bacterium]GLI33145.1 riboflavin synthase subunit alpha [Desulforhabdus amnigena]
MFTGLIEGTGTLLRIDHQGPDAKMVIQANYAMEGLTLGESIAVDGACLTVVSFQGTVFTADVSAETLNRTTLGRKMAGQHLNLERALRMGDRLGGHLVSGHVDGIGVLKERKKEGRSWRLFFEVPRELSRYIIEKGSVAVNGISLTVNGCSEGSFDVNIVPHTAKETTISEFQIGDEVNIETDIIGKYVEKMLRSWTPAEEKSTKSSRIDAAFLQRHGFL